MCVCVFSPCCHNSFVLLLCVCCFACVFFKHGICYNCCGAVLLVCVCFVMCVFVCILVCVCRDCCCWLLAFVCGIVMVVIGFVYDCVCCFFSFVCVILCVVRGLLVFLMCCCLSVVLFSRLCDPPVSVLCRIIYGCCFYMCVLCSSCAYPVIVNVLFCFVLFPHVCFTLCCYASSLL